jgi:hypothetical protein
LIIIGGTILALLAVLIGIYCWKRNASYSELELEDEVFQDYEGEESGIELRPKE